jgi:hypothetical protein
VTDEPAEVERLPGDLAGLHANPDFWQPLTGKMDRNIEETSTKAASLRAVVDILSDPKIRFTANRRSGSRILSLLQHLADSYYNFGHYEVNFSRELRKLAADPTTTVMSDEQSNANDAVPTIRRKEVMMTIGDWSSMFLAVDYSATSAHMSVSDVVASGQNALSGFNDFASYFTFLRAMREQFIDDYPAYGDFIQPGDLTSLAYSFVKDPHPQVKVAMEAYSKYGSRILHALDELPVPIGAIVTDKLHLMYALWNQALLRGLLGVDSRFIVKPTADSVLANARLLGSGMRWYDVFNDDGLEESDFSDFINSVNRGTGDFREPGVKHIERFFEPNTLIKGAWVSIKVGERSDMKLDALVGSYAQISTLSIPVASRWKDLREHLELARYERLPTIGALKAPFISLLPDDWVTNPWYFTRAGVDGLWPSDEGRMKFFYKVDIQTTVSRISRS